MRSLLKSILPSDKPDSSSLSYRQKVARDSISQASKLVADHATEGASPESTFISSQLPPLDVARRPNQPASLVDVINRDAFTVARHLIAETPDARGRIAVLNLASDALRAGGWEFSLSRTQVGLKLTLNERALISTRRRLYVTRLLFTLLSKKSTIHGQM